MSDTPSRSFEDVYRTQSAALDRLAKRLADSEAELTELREDKKRLDWLLKHVRREANYLVNPRLDRKSLDKWMEEVNAAIDDAKGGGHE